MEPHRVKISINRRGVGKVMLDGKEIACTRFSIASRAHRPARVRFEIIADVETEIETENVVTTARR
jgi:hypothetical protein